MSDTAQTKSDLTQKKCKACEGETAALSEKEIEEYLKKVSGWEFKEEVIQKEFGFKNYYQTVSFINAVAWIANQEDHHPDMTFGYKNCRVSFVTHSVGGITENDFICAAKIEALLS